MWPPVSSTGKTGSTVNVGRRGGSPTQAYGGYKLLPLPPGTAGIERTLKHMADFVRADCRNQAVRTIAESITADCGDHDFDAEIEALFRYVRDEVTFRRDPVDLERVSGAMGTLQSKVGDCDDKVVLLATLLCALGHESRFAVVSQGTNGEWDHVYLEIGTKSGWLPADPTSKSAQLGWETPHRRKWIYPIWNHGRYRPGPHLRTARPQGKGASRAGQGIGAFVDSGIGTFDDPENPYGYIDSTGWLGVSAQVSADFGSSHDLFGEGYPGEPCFQYEPDAPCASVQPIIPSKPVPEGLTPIELCAATGDCNYYVIDSSNNVVGQYDPTTGAITSLPVAATTTASTTTGLFAGCGWGCLLLLAIAAWLILD